MAVIDFPEAFTVVKQTWGLKRNDIETSESWGGMKPTGLYVASPLWTTIISLQDDFENRKGSDYTSFLLSLKGRANQVAIWNMGRPVPLGTMRGTMTLSSDVAIGDTTLNIIAAGEASKTLVKGDYLGVDDNQLVMVTSNSTSDGSGNISVSVYPAIRKPLLTGATVTWDAPKALFRLNTNNLNWKYTMTDIGNVSLDFIEDS